MHALLKTVHAVGDQPVCMGERMGERIRVRMGVRMGERMDVRVGYTEG